MAAHDHDHDDFLEAGHFTLRTYVFGFIAAAVLTIIPFWIVLTGAIPNPQAAATIVALALVQIGVHSYAFLHVNARAQGGWTLVTYVFTAVLVAITIGGSMWIMWHLNLNMMPGMTGGTVSGGM
mgnify:CR=1 FL=1